MKMVRNDQTQPLILIDCVHVPSETEREATVVPESSRSTELPFMEAGSWKD